MALGQSGAGVEHVAETPPPSAGLPIGVVDDEPALLDLLRDVLEAFGFPVVAFSSPEAVLSMAGHLTPRLFLIDLMLPGMSGIELARRLREGRFPGTPMVAMSASRSMLAAAATSRLFQGTVGKPFDLAALLTCVEAYAP